MLFIFSLTLVFVSLLIALFYSRIHSSFYYGLIAGTLLTLFVQIYIVIYLWKNYWVKLKSNFSEDERNTNFLLQDEIKSSSFELDDAKYSSRAPEKNKSLISIRFTGLVAVFTYYAKRSNINYFQDGTKATLRNNMLFLKSFKKQTNVIAVDLTNMIVTLEPSTLRRTNRWSVKYPIKLENVEGAKFFKKCSEAYLYCFTPKEKETFYYKLLRSATFWVDESHGPFDDSTNQYNDYIHSLYLKITEIEGISDNQHSSGVEKVQFTSQLNNFDTTATTTNISNNIENESIFSYFIKTKTKTNKTTNNKSEVFSYIKEKKVAERNALQSQKVLKLLNLLWGRIFWDMHLDPYWIEAIRQKIERNLRKIENHPLIGQLRLPNLSMGTGLPIIEKIVSASCSVRDGIAFDAMVRYDGGFSMTVEAEVGLGAQSDKLLLRPLFKKALDLVKERVQTVNVDLKVKVRSFRGLTLFRISSPPTDRLWYGFLQPPELDIAVNSKIGEVDVNMPLIIKFIEDKLKNLFYEALVYPNMEDVIIPLMSGSFKEYQNYFTEISNSYTESNENIKDNGGTFTKNTHNSNKVDSTNNASEKKSSLNVM